MTGVHAYRSLRRTLDARSRYFLPQAASSTTIEVDEDGFPETLNMGHLEAAVRVLAMLARGGCSRFEERLQLLLQVRQPYTARRKHVNAWIVQLTYNIETNLSNGVSNDFYPMPLSKR